MGYVKDTDIQSVVKQPAVPANEKEGFLEANWDTVDM